MNSTGPDGLGGVGLTDGEGVWIETSAPGAAGVGAPCLQAATSSKQQRKQKLVKTSRIRNELSSC